MTRIPRRRARALRNAAMRRLAEMIDVLEPGGLDPAVEVEYRTLVALDTALTTSPWWARRVRVPLPAQRLEPSAHKPFVTR